MCGVSKIDIPVRMYLLFSLVLYVSEKRDENKVEERG
ncbi:hypothetical protein SLEP1_g9765 [Rubroshorea leprosula]|uniref:Uncharacterized protein n=1 Tax=Rubroshorea leprosula TaxID=152421 RepID=A0AAV5IBN6_9ROSI|nr:hypothetical protein SLEP1_g9765 [Rubroshorea leprosula]